MLIPRTPVPPCGWNSYDSYRTTLDEASAYANLEAFVQKLAPHGYEYFVIDAGWYARYSQAELLRQPRDSRRQERFIDEWGRYVSSPTLFPRGLRALSDACHAAGVKFGVHMMRGIPTPAVEANTPVKGHPTARARDIVDSPAAQCRWCDYFRPVNLDAPGAQEYYDSVAEYLLEDLQVDFVKLDDATPYPRDIEAFAKALDKFPRPVILSLSEGNTNDPLNWPVYERWGNMVRLTKDIWDRDTDNLCKFDRWRLFEGHGGPDCWLDLDMLPLGLIQANVPPGTPEADIPVLGCARQSGLSPAGKRVLLSLAALACSPLFYGGDVPGSDPGDIALATDPGMLACNRNGIPARKIFQERHVSVYRTPDRNDPAHGWIGVFLREWGLKEPKKVWLKAGDLGFADDAMPPAFEDVWGRKPVTPAKGGLELALGSYDCALLRF